MPRFLIFLVAVVAPALAAPPNVVLMMADDLGWGDVGFNYLFSNSAVAAPGDIKKTKMWVWDADPISKAVMDVAGVNGVAPLWAAVNANWQPRTRYPQPQEHNRQETDYLGVMEALLEAGADPDGRLEKHPWYMVYTGCGNRNCGLENTA